MEVLLLPIWKQTVFNIYVWRMDEYKELDYFIMEKNFRFFFYVLMWNQQEKKSSGHTSNKQREWGD